MKILILDDEYFSVFDKAETNFIKLGHEIHGCLSSNEAFEYLKEKKASKEALPDLCFFDVRLVGEEPLDGIDAASIVIKEYQIPVVLFSGMAFTSEYGNKFAKKIQEHNFPRAYYVARGELEVLEKLRLLIEDVEENYEHPDIPSPLSEKVFDLEYLKIGLMTSNSPRVYEFIAKCIIRRKLYTDYRRKVNT